MFVHDALLNGWTISGVGVVTRTVFLVRVSRDGCGTSGVSICGHSNSVSELFKILGDTVGKETEEVMHRDVKCFASGCGKGMWTVKAGFLKCFMRGLFPISLL